MLTKEQIEAIEIGGRDDEWEMSGDLSMDDARELRRLALLGLERERDDAISRTYVPLDEMKKRIDAYWDGRRDALRYVAIGSAATCAMQGCSEDSFAATWYRWISWMSVNALVHLGDEDAKRMVGGES